MWPMGLLFVYYFAFCVTGCSHLWKTCCSNRTLLQNFQNLKICFSSLWFFLQIGKNSAGGSVHLKIGFLSPKQGFTCTCIIESIPWHKRNTHISISFPFLGSRWILSVGQSVGRSVCRLGVFCSISFDPFTSSIPNLVQGLP